MYQSDEIEKLKAEVDFLKEEHKFWTKEIKDLETFLIRKFSGPMLDFEVHLAEHCNLNCKGCDHFSPLAKPRYADYDIFCKDFNRLSVLMGDSVNSINLLGGEPLLNPRICDFITAARRYFSNTSTEIRVVTNGLLLDNMEDQFWSVCAESDVHIYVTKYPINLDYERIFAGGQNKGVQIDFYDPQPDEKSLYRVPLTLAGNMDPKRSFYKCPCANLCCFLKEGRLYTCTLIPNIHHFNEYFGVDLPVSEEDSIDIYQATSKTEIFDFLSKPTKFCRFCASEEKEYGLKWCQSERKIEEWLL